MLAYMYGDHMGWGWGVLMTLGWAILLGLLIVLVIGALRGREQRTTARELLDQRLANGEITVEEYERARAAMSASSGGPSAPQPPAPV